MPGEVHGCADVLFLEEMEAFSLQIKLTQFFRHWVQTRSEFVWQRTQYFYSLFEFMDGLSVSQKCHLASIVLTFVY